MKLSHCLFFVVLLIVNVLCVFCKDDENGATNNNNNINNPRPFYQKRVRLLSLNSWLSEYLTALEYDWCQQIFSNKYESNINNA